MSNRYALPAEQDEQDEDPGPGATDLEKAAVVHDLKGKVLVVKLGGSTLDHQKMVIRDLIGLQKLGFARCSSMAEVPRSMPC